MQNHIRIPVALVAVAVAMAGLVFTFQNCSPSFSSATQVEESSLVPFNPIDPTDNRGKLQRFTEEYPPSWVEMYAKFIFKLSTELVDASFLNSSFLPPPNINSGKKRMLIIGDSISLCYTPAVRQLLSDKLEVHRVPHNGASTELGLLSVDKYLQAGPWDIVTVNWGLHDLTYFADKPQQHKTLIEEYRRRLEEVLLPRLKMSGARLIWIRTTQSNNHPLHRPSDIDFYNQVSDGVMQRLGIPQVDLMAGSTQIEFIPDNLHFTQATCSGFARRIDAAVRSALP